METLGTLTARQEDAYDTYAQAASFYETVVQQMYMEVEVAE